MQPDEAQNDLQAVIFDLDGVLCATEELHYRSWEQALARYHLPFSRWENERLRGLTRFESLRTLLGGRPLPQDWFDDILEHKGRYYVELLDELTPSDLAPGVNRLLRELRAAGLKIGVASSSRLVLPVLERLDVLAWMDAVVDGGQVARSKPAPDSYLKAAAALDLPPAGCIAVEDSPAGITAAHAAGMRVIGLGPPDRVGAADAVFPDLSGVQLADLQSAGR
ncbi:MAG: HAD family hydrolase [Chloroflexota bacterium]